MSVSQYPSTFVTPAKAGVHHLPWKFRGSVMDSRLRGNDEFLELKGLEV
jgi:hypothetical protein